LTTTATLRVRADCDEECFDSPAWPRLRALDPNRHVFSTPEWNKLWWDEFKAGKELLLLTFERDDEVAAILPLYRKLESGVRVLRFVGGIDLTDYLGPVCSPADREEVAESLIDWLEHADLEWDELDAHNMPVPSGFVEYLVDRADRHGLPFRLDQEQTSAVLPLPGNWDSYLSALDKKQRHELRRKRRRLERTQPEARFRTTTPETLERDLRLFVDLHRGTEGHKGHFMRPEITSFFERIALDFSTRGWLRLDFLEANGVALASTFGFELDGRFYLYNSAYEAGSARLSPGLVLVSELVKGSIARGLESFDFLRGPERYKYELGAQPVPLNNVRVLNAR
jgi:CelD/BcsL family acetyltransferase involved in cellulose biosynthesis